MSMEGSSGAGSRKGPIRPDIVVDAALALVNLGGLESLTMRGLSDALGTQPPALYRLFRDKDALVDAMADAVLASALGPLPETSWETRVIVLAGRLRAAMLDQRDGARIVGGAYTTRQPTLTVADSLLAAMGEAGFTGEAAVWAITTVFSYVLGEALEQQGRAEVDLEEVQATVSAEDYPHLARSPLPALLDFDARFAFGLRMITAGLREEAQTFHPGETVPGAASNATAGSPTDGTPAPTSRTTPPLPARKAAPAEPGP
ncbi:TetR/AcrR family transcriptional regulator C-terminal domain-containing protein [Streptomyces sp. MS1.AVA.3]|uniref:TetR/AcrR family transcriptional regulator C-terminal domain-containing protein n=1 Tax=Streptomyces decoyicus TaxID=249567 RepID=UPI0030C24960